MNRGIKIKFLLPCIMATVLGYVIPAFAADDPPYSTDDFAAGTACSSFDLRIEAWLGNKDIREEKNKNGVLRTISAGTGTALRFTNLDTGKTFSTQSKGAAEITRINPDGLVTKVLTGHSTIVLFQTDSPPGPSTTLYAGGRLVFSIDARGNFTVLEESGNKINICAALS